MADKVRMVSNTVFQNDRVTTFADGGPPEGELGRTVTVGDEFETDPLHARELAAAGHAVPASGSLDDIPDHPLEPHHQVSVDDLRADRARRAMADGAEAAEVQTDRGPGAATEAPTGREPAAVTTQRSGRRQTSN